MKFNLIISLFLICATAISAFAEGADSLEFNQEKLFVGARVGVSSAEADFSSLGADKFRPGWGVGFNLGYRFTNVWSLEMTATWGQSVLAEQNCCFDRHYFLGSDLKRYQSILIPDGMNGWFYSDLLSKVYSQKYGVHANMNILGLFETTKAAPWRLEIGPALYAVGTSADLITKADRTPIAENINSWHFAYGGNLYATYSIADAMNVGVYFGYTQMTGAQIDAMPELHITNYMMDAGIKFTIGLTRSKRSAKIRRDQTSAHVNHAHRQVETVPAEAPVDVIPTGDAQVVVAPVGVAPIDDVTSADVISTNATPIEVAPTDVTPADVTIADVAPVEEVSVEVAPVQETMPTEHPVATVPSDDMKEVETPETVQVEQKSEAIAQRYSFPVIYFSFNSVWIEPSERAKVKAIADIMKSDKSIRILVTGWCDPVGSEEANKRVSLQRAEAVKRVLGQWLIPADRVETAGGGVNHEAASNDEARYALTIEIL